MNFNGEEGDEGEYWKNIDELLLTKEHKKERIERFHGDSFFILTLKCINICQFFSSDLF